MISKSYGLQHVSTGDILRDEVAKQTPLGKKAKSFMNAGELVPDQLVVDMIASRLESNFLLDGFPRSLPQAEGLEKILSGKKWAIDSVLNLDVPEGVIVSRLSGRLVCTSCKAVFASNATGPCAKCGGPLGKRADDNPDTVRERLRVYKEKTKPLEDYYAKKGLLVGVNGVGSPEEIFARVKAVLKK